MKKIALTLSALLVLVLALALTSCGGTAETTTETATTTTEPVITTEALPEGYVLFDNGDISFAYPESLTKTDGSTVILSDGTNGNNITVVYEAKTNYYEKMTATDYANDLRPAFSAMGMTIKGYSVNQIKNAKGTSITKIAHTASVSDITLKQTMLVITAGEKTYTVTVTEMVNDSALVNNVLNTLGLTK